MYTCSVAGAHRAASCTQRFAPPAGVLPESRPSNRIIRDALEPATIGPCGEGSEPGIEGWLFNPAPWCFAVAPDAADEPEPHWLALSVVTPIGQQTLTTSGRPPQPLATQINYDRFLTRLDAQGIVP
jgi:hypothetical protein